jgi:ubiquinone/menaquinone biosynthesis C-methylase UbiE
MSFNWINPENYSINTLLLMDKWIIEYFLGLGKTSEGHYRHKEYRTHLGNILANNPAIKWCFYEKCPEAKDRINDLIENIPQNLSKDSLRESELYVLDAQDSFVVYAYPEVMEELDYIKHWKPETLLSMVEFLNKIVLDIGSGTGRLAFSVANIAKEVYAIDPVDRLREFLRKKRDIFGIKNLRISDGTIEEIPYPDNTFDIIMSGHVMGDDFDKEMEEMVRVVKNGGYILTCIGEDNVKREPNKDMIRLGFEQIYYKSILGGDIYNYRKEIIK